MYVPYCVKLFLLKKQLLNRRNENCSIEKCSANVHCYTGDVDRLFFLPFDIYSRRSTSTCFTFHHAVNEIKLFQAINLISTSRKAQHKSAAEKCSRKMQPVDVDRLHFSPVDVNRLPFSTVDTVDRVDVQ